MQTKETDTFEMLIVPNPEYLMEVFHQSWVIHWNGGHVQFIG